MLAPAGDEARHVAQLFRVMLPAAVLIWIAMMLFMVVAKRADSRHHTERGAQRIVFWGGVVFPTTTLAALLAYGLTMLPAMRAEMPSPTLTVRVTGEQWWWRVVYERDGERVESANELRLPVGEPVAFVLDSPDVIHSFWIPALGGKLDMIPGRINRFVLVPERTGRFRGQCAEYCGTAHAWMAFSVEVMTSDGFARWLRAESRPVPEGVARAEGADLFLASGCGACHSVRGTRARGEVGPDLTRLAARRYVGAGVLPMTHDALARWITAPGQAKPAVRMPAYGMLPQQQIDTLASWLGRLR